LSFKYWSKAILFLALSFFIFTALFNYVVNPYSIFNHNIFSNFLVSKNHIVSARMLTFYTAIKENPKNIMIGSSRIGTFSKSEIERYLDGKSFNMAMPGSNIEEQTKYIEYMIKNHNIKNIVWGLDFYSFNPDLQNDPDFSYTRLNSSLLLRDDFKIALISLQTTKNSFKTIIDNLKRPKKQNSISLENIKQKENKEIQKFSKEIILQKTNDLLIQYTKKYFNSNKFKEQSSIDINIQKINNIIKLCKKKNINLYIYTSPVQKKFLDLYANLGLENTFIYWKKELAKITAYTDFCQENVVTDNIYNFMDGSHIMPNFGKLIFGEIFHNKNINIPKGFGIQIKQEN